MLRVPGVVLLSTLSLLTACSGIRVVQQTNRGGVVALRGPRDGAWEKAEEYMHGRCPSGFDVIEQGEAVVGQDTRVRTDTSTAGNTQTSSSTAETRDVREWRVTYRCVDDVSAQARVLVVPM